MNEDAIYEQLSLDDINKLQKYDSLNREVQRIRNSISDLETKILKSERQISIINKKIEEIKNLSSTFNNCESLDMSSPIKFLPSDVIYLDQIEDLKTELSKKDRFIEELKLRIDSWTHYVEKYEKLKHNFENMLLKLNSFDKIEYSKILDRIKQLDEKIRKKFLSIKHRYEEKEIWRQNKGDFKNYLKLLTSIKRQLYNRQKYLILQQNNKELLEETIKQESLEQEKLKNIIQNQNITLSTFNNKILDLENQLLKCDKENMNNFEAPIESKIAFSQNRLNEKEIKLQELNISLGNQIHMSESLNIEKSKLDEQLENCKKRLREKEQQNHLLKNTLISSCKELLDKNLRYVSEEREIMKKMAAKKMKSGNRFVY